MRVLLTGPTGLLGSALLAKLLHRGHLLLAVGRCRGSVSARERLRRILDAQGEPPPDGRLRVFEAARGAPAWAGLEGWLAAEGPVDAVVHTAAAVKFTCTREELWRENLEASGLLLDVLDRAAPGAAFHFLSTAYICGERGGVCFETEGWRGQPFRQPYEESKLLAEELVARRCREASRPLSVYRPSIIGGDSLTGAAANFNGLGHFLRSLDVLARSLSPRTGCRARTFIRCDPEAGKNVVPVDWTAEAIATLLACGRAGRNYHLTHPRPLLHRELLEFARSELGLEGLEIVPSREGDLPGPPAPAQRLLDGGLAGLTPYLWGEPSFDRTHLEEDLGPAAEPPPVGRDYLGRLLTFGRGAGWSRHPLEEAPAAASAPPAVRARPARAAIRGGDHERDPHRIHPRPR